MQIAVQNHLIVHRMDVKTAYLHVPIEEEIFSEQPKGFEKTSETGEKLVYKLKIKNPFMALNNQGEIGTNF